MPLLFEDLRQRGGRVGVIIHNKDPRRRGGWHSFACLRQVFGGGLNRGSLRRRKMDNKFAPLSGAVAVGHDRSTVQLDQTPHKRESDAQASLRTLERRYGL